MHAGGTRKPTTGGGVFTENKIKKRALRVFPEGS
jgi:hypothetical protein